MGESSKVRRHCHQLALNPAMLNRSLILLSHLVGDVRSRVADVAVHLAHDTNMFVRVEQGVFLLALCAWSVSAIDCLVCLETGV